jgi:hypothetical protein
MGTDRIEKENDSLRNQTVYLHQLIQMNEQKAGVNFISKNGVGTQRLNHQRNQTLGCGNTTQANYGKSFLAQASTSGHSSNLIEKRVSSKL